MYNNVIVVPLLPKIADCAQQDRVLDLTRLFPSLAVGKGSGPRDYIGSAQTDLAIWCVISRTEGQGTSTHSKISIDDVFSPASLAFFMLFHILCWS